MSIQIHDSRKQVLADEFAQPYFQDIKQGLLTKKEAGDIIYPAGSKIFNAFNCTPFDKVRVVILGQDPYHGPGQAHGLCFSVQDGVKLPPSLKNIFKEVSDDIGIQNFDKLSNVPPVKGVDSIERSERLSGGGILPTSGDLTYLAEQGVFLLNAILTVTAKQPASHKDLGREQFTDAVIRKISGEKTGVIFLLRGNFARKKKELIDTTKHIVLEAPHPSPFSVHKGFFGCKHFSQTNQLLQMQGKKPIQRLKG